MNKLYILLALTVITGTLQAETERNISRFNRTDSTYNYTWDASSNTWKFTSVQNYFYNSSGKLSSVLERSVETGNPVSLTEFTYNDQNLATVQLTSSWNGSWNPVVKTQIGYDDFGRTSEMIVRVYSNGNWTDNRWQKNYMYDDSSRLLSFEMYYWRNNTWSAPTTDYSTYDSLGRLIKRQALYSDGKTDYIINYTYDSAGLRSEAYAKYPSGNDWLNWWLISYQYNGCGTQTSQVQFKGVLTNWIPQSKTDIFNSFNTDLYPFRKVPVCHNGHTIWVSVNAIPAHLKHGDCLGECLVEDKTCDRRDRNEDNPKKPPFDVYPNPAKERLTVRFDDQESDDMKRLELTDSFGKVLRVFNIKGSSDLTINRGNLLPGKYYLRLTGKEGYSLLVIFQ